MLVEHCRFYCYKCKRVIHQDEIIVETWDANRQEFYHEVDQFLGFKGEEVKTRTLRCYHIRAEKL